MLTIGYSQYRLNTRLQIQLHGNYHIIWSICSLNSDVNRSQEIYNEPKRPKLYLYEECKSKCSEYNGLPSAFHKYEQVISRREMKILNRGDVSSSGNLFFVDSDYDYARARWYSGGSTLSEHTLCYIPVKLELRPWKNSRYILEQKRYILRTQLSNSKW